MSNKYEIALPERSRYSRRNKRFALISRKKRNAVSARAVFVGREKQRERENVSAGRGYTHMVSNLRC